MLKTIDLIFLIVAIIIFITMLVVVKKSDKQFRDKSLDIKKGMSEKEVLDIMIEDPISIEPLKNGGYEWIYERKQYVGWGMMTVRIEISFDIEKHVTSVTHNKTYQRNDQKKE